MHSFWIIFKQAFMTKARTKSFIITTIIVAAGFFLLANLPNIIETFTGDDEGLVLHVVDRSGYLVPQLQVQLEQADSEIQAMPTDLSETQLQEGITEGTIDAYLVIEGGDTLSARYVSESANEIGAGREVENAVQGIQTALTAERLGLSGAEVGELFLPVNFEREAVSDSAKTEEEMSQARGLVYVLILLIYVAVIYYPNMIAMEVANEKSSRVMEILISSVSPVKHMFAKILGIGTLGIVQMMIFGIAGYFAIKTSASDMTEGFFSVMGFSDIKVGTFLFAILSSCWAISCMQFLRPCSVRSSAARKMSSN